MAAWLLLALIAFSGPSARAADQALAKGEGKEEGRPALPDPLAEVPCAEPAARLARSLKADVTAWVRQAPNEFNGRSYRAPTMEIGVWVELREIGATTLQLVRLSPEGRVATTWSAPGCAPRIEQAEYKLVADPGQRIFTDLDLRKRVADSQASGRPGFVLIWTPGMSYSVTAQKAARAAAEKVGGDLTILLAPHARQRQAEHAARRARIPLEDRRAESVELISRGMLVHLPSMVAFADGRLSRRKQVGALRLHEYEHQMRKLLREIREDVPTHSGDVR